MRVALTELRKIASRLGDVDRELIEAAAQELFELRVATYVKGWNEAIENAAILAKNHSCVSAIRNLKKID